MFLLDVNILVYAHRADLAPHPLAHQFLDGLLHGTEMFGVPEIVFGGFVRVVTQPKLNPPSTTEQALDFCSAVRSSTRCVVVQPSERHWHVFDQLCRTIGARAKLVADAYLAAFALDRDATWMTADADFAKFPELRWQRPSEPQPRTNPR